MGSVVIGAVALFVLLVIIEGKRQQRRYGRGSGRGASLLRTGMLDLQRHLEADRKVEVLMQEPDESSGSESGDPPTPRPY